MYQFGKTLLLTFIIDSSLCLAYHHLCDRLAWELRAKECTKKTKPIKQVQLVGYCSLQRNNCITVIFDAAAKCKHCTPSSCHCRYMHRLDIAISMKTLPVFYVHPKPASAAPDVSDACWDGCIKDCRLLISYASGPHEPPYCSKFQSQKESHSTVQLSFQ